MFTRISKTSLAGLVVSTAVMSLGLLNLGNCSFLPSTSPPTVTTATPVHVITPTPTNTPGGAATATAIAFATATATKTPTPVTLFSSNLTGSASVTANAIYPTNFFTAAATGDILFTTLGDGTITPPSASRLINVTVTSGNATSKPQIQFRFNGTTTTAFTAPSNTANSLSTSFTSNSTTTLSFSIIDTGAPAGGVSYTVLITQ